MRFRTSGCACLLVLLVSATASAQDSTFDAPPLLRRPAMDGALINSTFQPDLPGGESMEPIPQTDSGYGGYGYGSYPYANGGIPTPQYGIGDGYFPYARVAPDACCQYESACDDPTQYKLRVFTFHDAAWELWNEVLFGVPDPSCRFDANCSQGPPTCCRKHGWGVLDLFPEHKEAALARRADACGCSGSNQLYTSANPPPHQHGYGHGGPAYGAYNSYTGGSPHLANAGQSTGYRTAVTTIPSPGGVSTSNQVRQVQSIPFTTRSYR